MFHPWNTFRYLFAIFVPWVEHISLFPRVIYFYVELNTIIVMTFKEDFKPTKVYNKLVNNVCYNADCLEEFEKQRLVVANPFSYNKSTRTGIVAEFDNGYHLSKEVGIKRNFVTIGMRVWDIIRKIDMLLLFLLLVILLKILNLIVMLFIFLMI